MWLRLGLLYAAEKIVQAFNVVKDFVTSGCKGVVIAPRRAIKISLSWHNHEIRVGLEI